MESVQVFNEQILDGWAGEGQFGGRVGGLRYFGIIGNNELLGHLSVIANASIYTVLTLCQDPCEYLFMY